MAEYVFKSTTARGKLSGFTATITTGRSAEVLYENDVLRLDFQYTWKTTTSTSTTTSTTYVPKAIHFYLAPNICTTSTTPPLSEVNLFDLGTFELGSFSSGTTVKPDPITKTFKVNIDSFNYFLENTTSTNAQLKPLLVDHKYIDQTPVYFKLCYDIDQGDYKPDGPLLYSYTTIYKPLYYGNLGFNIKGEIERCDDTGVALEQGEYIHWSSLYLESLNTTLDNDTLPRAYISRNFEDISIQYGISDHYGEIIWTPIKVTQQVLDIFLGVNHENDLKYFPGKENPYTEQGIISRIIPDNLRDTLNADLTVQITIKTNLNGTFTGTFSLPHPFAKLHVSGYSDGGVAIGKFSSSASQGRPLFEVDSSHESIFGGAVNFNRGINTVDSAYCISSLNALGIQSGYWATPEAFCSDIDNNKLAKSKSKVYNVNFPRQYAQLPVVNVSLCNTTDPTNPATVYNCVKCTYNIETISTTGFSVKVLNISATTRYPNFTWLAMGNIIEGDRDSTIRRPDANRPMTRNNEGTMIARASSQYSSSYAAYKAFDNTTTSYWRSAAKDTDLWIGLYLGVKIKNTTVVINNVSGTHPRGLRSGEIFLYNAADPANPFGTRPSYSTQYGAKFDQWAELGIYTINCSNTGEDTDQNDNGRYFDTVLIKINEFYNGSGAVVNTSAGTNNYCQIGQIVITGNLKKPINNNSGQEENDPEAT